MKSFKMFVGSLTLLLSSFQCQPEKEEVPIDLNELTISTIHTAFKDGSYTSEQLVSAYLKRIEALDKNINSITYINRDAILIARSLDEEYKNTKVLRPLHGIPVIVKDNIHTIGIPTTAGALAMENFIPKDDAFIIGRLVKAGAVVIAKSNMAEWAYTAWASFSTTHGATHNPYHLDYSPAGSSGGTGASIASNFGVIGLGTDTGNSIRGPSSHNALVGFRATMGLISRGGVIPLLLRNDMAGPMCRTVEDATRVLQIIAGYDPGDPLTQHAEGNIPENYLQYLERDGLKGVRLGVLHQIADSADPEIAALFEKAQSDLKRLGAEVVTVDIPDFDNVRADQWCDEFRKDIETYLATYVKNDTLKVLEDIIRIGTRSAFVADELIRHQQQNWIPRKSTMECMDAYNDQRRIAFRNAVVGEMDKSKLDAIIYPSWNIKPLKVDAVVKGYQDVPGINSEVIAPHTGQPAFTVPMGFMNENLPVGLEFLGRMYAEPTLIKLTYAYEQGTKHRLPPPLK